jgi:heat shock protein HtpX
MPKLYLVPEAAPNAFATGRDAKHAVVAVTQGLLERLDRSELEGVLAHELSHIGNRDMLVSTVAVVLVGVLSITAEFFLRRLWWGGRRDDRGGGNGILMLIGIVFAILAPIAGQLMQLAISRKREFLADASGALLTRYPDGLANALRKISADPTPMRQAANNTTAHLWLDDPYKGKERMNWLHKLFMTHPPIEERIKALEGMDIERTNG